ncbi:MAG: aminodeoxychorismate/anthranilate synthase component II [Gemmatimonadetes bacterium]|uniref:Aminodeoxychorismate/anthranilate synthase component II n=1 Tax=Candidatus Kutchimonas denitrificans TaxID=3056748 RepID=A0AAE5CCL1_9BACT|nr:aminodeoxychorismate/anthranilate synthase component II [Gemmatimonadota bacterium]NIR74324.1 aminodeoxychorismate/anthranilate synthase component II [Candidatus Kutchimonas denitrificans]NIS01380.1 aminodeoxychorismate/anthranilate synthase component II [Gemmatimonadota bacterium]NIT67120.1 aminodeoxychorismate/anthranilate synthase component II [Gemmatimonadota bacterium]NIU52776.1 anthranilate/aminodeoxychorismate synthase component II [Gemmatimonadota bacterium]
MILVIDNYDSFTYNLVQMLGALGAQVEVYRNDAIDADGVAAREPAGVVISPGPCRPEDAPGAMEIVQRMAPVCPTLGVCLGHQAIATVFGARVERAPAPMHGKTSRVEHDSQGVFINVINPLEVGRYHSLAVIEETLPPELVVTARSDDGVVMGLRHREYPLEGVQFHPESILTPEGETMLGNFLRMATHPTAGWRSAVRG